MLMFTKMIGKSASGLRALAPISVWEFNEVSGATTFVDAVGLCNATILGGVTSGVAGKLNRCLYMNRSGTPTANNTAYDFASSDFSISMWIKPSFSSTLCFVFSKINSSNNRQYFCYGDNSIFGFYVYQGTNYISATIPVSNLPSTSWSHVVVAYKKGQTPRQNGMHIYVNGIDMSATRGMTGTFTDMTTVNTPLDFGTYRPSMTYNYTGSMDQVAVFNKFLETVDVAKIYNSGEGIEYSNVPITSILFDGNSWVYGTGSTGGLTFPSQTISLLNANSKSSTLINYGVGGQTITQMQSDAVTQIDPNHTTSKIMVGLEVVNEWGINTSESISTIYNMYKQYFLDRKSAGFQYVIAVTPTPQGYYSRSNWETDRTWLINQMKSEFPSLGILISDSGSDSRLSDYNNTTYYASDKIHKTNTGQAVEAEILYNLINTLI